MLLLTKVVVVVVEKQVMVMMKVQDHLMNVKTLSIIKKIELNKIKNNIARRTKTVVMNGAL